MRRGFGERLAALAVACCLCVPVAGVQSADGPSMAQRHKYSKGDFVTQGAARKRSPDVTQAQVAMPPRALFVVVAANSNDRSRQQDASPVIERLQLVVRPAHEVTAGDALATRLIASGEIEKYPDIRTDAGMQRYAQDHGGMFMVEWEDGVNQTTHWFELKVFEVASGDLVFRARRNLSLSTEWARGTGGLHNELLNPVFNSFVDWFRAQSARPAS